MSCKSLLLEKGIRNITIAHLAKVAGIGKGTIYEYFKNKEDIVFEIITSFIEEYEFAIAQSIEQYSTIKEKLHFLFLMLHENRNFEKQKVIHQEFLAIALTNGTPEMSEFSIACKKRFESILTNLLTKSIEDGELKDCALEYIPSLMIFEKGLIVDSVVSSVIANQELERFLDMFMKLTSKEK